MSSIYRLFGVDFQSTHLDIEYPKQPGETGFTLGAKTGFTKIAQGLMGICPNRLLAGLGLSGDDALDFEDEVKYGNPQVIALVRDFLSGYEHAACHMDMQKETLNKLDVCLAYTGRHRIEAKIDFFSEDPDFSKATDFFVEGVGAGSDVGDVPRLSFLSVIKYGFTLKGEHLLIGPEQNISFRVHKDNQYNQEVCRAIHAFTSVVVDHLYQIIDENMFAQFSRSGVDYVRNVVEKRACGQGTAYFDADIPNFYLQQDKSKQ